MKILGDIRPYTNEMYTYTMVTNAGAPVKVALWEVYYKGRRLAENDKGIFRFGTNLGALSLKLVAYVRNPDTRKLVEYSIQIQPLIGKPQLLKLYWQDINKKEIGNREVAYLDKVTLVVKTQNIPQGDRLKVTIYEDEYADGHAESSRDMGSLYTQPVTKNGYAYLELQNMTLYQKKLNKMDYVNEGTHEYYARIQYYNKLNQIEDKIQLKVKNELKQIVQQDLGNKPQKIGEVESTHKNKKGLNFTFGVFIDGTLNNMYNTEMKQKMDSMIDTQKAAPRNATGLNDRMKLKDFQDVYKHGDPDYGESSYENDLSNPAILFKNYVKKEKEYQYSIYTEGVGTHSSPQEQGGELRKRDYKSDDLMQAPAFGMGNAGIMDKVRKSIKDVVNKIWQVAQKQNDTYIDTITFDVFGFSRGAAAARHFVHVVTHDPYKPKQSLFRGDNEYVKDLQGNEVNSDLYYDKMMPRFGVLGQKLQDAKLLDERTKVKIRFVGIYDTVPHHGAFQINDIKDLGLNDVNKADYVVHMVAADEYRANFDLVDISSVAKVSPQSGKKGGIELTYPGVHCDVGGAYVEGGGNRCYKLALGYNYTNLEKEKKEFVEQGWYKENELGIYEITDIRDINHFGGYRLQGYKKDVSNQYSYIPLHIMRKFCNMKNVPINEVKLMEFKQFKKNWMKDNITFLNGIKKKLWDYSFNGGKTITFKNDGDNEEIRKLRYHYLHWNSTYGDRREAFGTWVSGKNHPNIINGKRKRNVH
ncbi:DUF2235 domain-containing protein [Chryseobacterium sp.]|uniref:T6SS phospholipase effector Tle1-like catalytic domain-containing protein n=1 Tax=Chryseobacterium sp. TaxID=1871047 RepID=UPI0028968E2F|nr:DUF2235 domain-containing protein [Chryseobacterium sp.]